MTHTHDTPTRIRDLLDLYPLDNFGTGRDDVLALWGHIQEAIENLGDEPDADSTLVAAALDLLDTELGDLEERDGWDGSDADCDLRDELIKLVHGWE